MKKLFYVLCLMILAVLCAFGAVACSGDGDDDAQIVAIYNQYVAYAEGQGITPLSYEEWLETIKGEKGDKGDKGDDGEDGDDGQTPYIGSNGNWFIGTTDTGVKAQGSNGLNGANGNTPYILNGYWYIDGVSTGVKAEGKDGVDGKDGKDGKEILSVSFENNKVVVEYTDGTKTYFDVEMKDLTKVDYPEYVKYAPYYEYCADLDFDSELSEAGVKGIFFNSVPYKGKYTKVAAYIGYPANASKDNKVPAIVLVHGAGGTAMPDWVKYWNDLGYAAIAIDTEGAEPKQGVALDTPLHNERNRYENGVLSSVFTAGPYNHGMRDGNEKVEDQWMYHASAAAMVGASLLLDDERVDSTKLGITGISYGSIVTTVAISHDDRFNFAIPVYGGVSIDQSVSSFWNLYYQDMSQEYIDNYYAEMVARWDNLDGLKNTDCKVYYITSTTDFAFSMDIASRCAEAANGYCNFKVGYNHNNTDGSKEATISAFANYCVGKESDLVLIEQAPTIYNNKLKFTTYGNIEISGIKLLYTNDDAPYTGDPNGKIPNYTATWIESASYRKIKDGEYEFAIPACKLYYVRVEYANGQKQACTYLMQGSDLSFDISNNFYMADDFTQTLLEDSNVFESNHVINHDANNLINYGGCLQSVEIFGANVQPDDGYIVYKLDAGEGKTWTNLSLDIKAMLSHSGGAYWYNGTFQGGDNVLGANIYVEVSDTNGSYNRICDLNEVNGNWITKHNHMESREGATFNSTVDLTSYASDKQVIYVRIYIMHMSAEEINIPAWGSPNSIGHIYVGAGVDKVSFTGNAN